MQSIKVNINKVLKRRAIYVLSTIKEILGKSKSRIVEKKKTLWWYEEVQRIIVSKEKQFQ